MDIECIHHFIKAIANLAMQPGLKFKLVFCWYYNEIIHCPFVPSLSLFISIQQVYGCCNVKAS